MVIQRRGLNPRPLKGLAAVPE